LFGNERNLPAVHAVLARDPFPDHLVIEIVEDLLGIEPERVDQRGNRQLALAVDADVDDVLGVEFEIEPRTAIGDHTRGEQQLARGVGLAAVMIEQHTGRTVHLADDHAFGPVDDEGAVLGHERHVAHVNVLFLDIEYRAGLGFAVDLEHDQAQRHLHRRRIGDATLAAFGGIVLGILKHIMHEIELGCAGEIADREDRAQRLFKTRDIAGGLVRTQELLIAFALNLDQVRHLNHFVDIAEDLADPLFRRARYLPGRNAPGAFRLGNHGGNSPLSICAAAEMLLPGVKNVQFARERGPTTATQTGRGHGTPLPGATAAFRSVANMGPAASILLPIPAQESALLEACGRRPIVRGRRPVNSDAGSPFIDQRFIVFRYYRLTIRRIAIIDYRY